MGACAIFSRCRFAVAPRFPWRYSKIETRSILSTTRRSVLHMEQSTEPTLRERSKRDKRRRIEQAAREIFAERGFDKATTRDIAGRAGISVATLFVYAPDKAQLLKAIFETELDRITEDAVSTTTEDALVVQLIAFFRPRYELWVRDPRLSRAAILIGFAAYIEAANSDREPPNVWGNMRNSIRDILHRNRDCGRLEPHAVLDRATEAVFSIYLTQVHVWISQRNPDLEEGLSTLAALLEIVCTPLEVTT